jgi:membrane fusion protein (multidrug efflux system)
MNRVLPSIGLISCFSIFSCTQKPPAPTPPVPVNLYTVKAQQVFYYDNYPSTTQALSQVALQPQIQGYITAIYVKDGADVVKGQPLYETDRRLYQNALDAAEAALKVVQGNLELAQQDADRYEYLNSYHAVATQVYDHAMIALKNAKNQVSAAEDSVKSAKTNLSYSIITAPFNGTVGFSQVRLGNYVTPGQTVLNTISTNDPMAVDFLVNEKQLPAFEKLQDGRNGRSTDSLFTILMPDGSKYAYDGKISVIDRAVDPQTGSIRVRLVFPNPKGDLKVGMSCVVRVHNQETTPQMVIPSKAVVEQMGEFFVFVAKDTVMAAPDSAGKKSSVDSAGKKSSDTASQVPKLRAFQKKVMLGQTIGANVIVVSGLRPGDKIVIDGVQALHDGSIISAGKKQGAPGNGKDSTNSANKADSSKNN